MCGDFACVHACVSARACLRSCARAYRRVCVRRCLRRDTYTKAKQTASPGLHRSLLSLLPILNFIICRVISIAGIIIPTCDEPHCSNAGREWQRRPKLSSLADADDTTAISFTLMIFCDLLLGCALAQVLHLVCPALDRCADYT